MNSRPHEVRMRILVCTLLYKPDGGPSAPLFEMLCKQFAKMGHDVTIITAVPHYPSGRVQPEFKKGWIQRSQENGVNVIRVRVPSVNRARLFLRLIQFLSYQLGATVAGLHEKYDVMLVTNPAIEVGLPFAVLAALKRKPAVFSVYDVYPDVGVQLGIFRNRFVIRAVEAAERFCLSHAQYVHTLFESFVPALRRMGVTDNKLACLYVWIDTDYLHPVPRDNDFAKEFDLVDKFVVLYAGNIGLSQGLDRVLFAAENLATQKHIHFVFVGDGSGREALVAHAKERHLSNVQFIPFQSHSRVPEVLGTGDLALVSLQPQIGTSSLPSKTFSYLASQRPIIAIVDEGSATWQLVKRAEAGIPVISTQFRFSPELITDGENGFLIPGGDRYALASAVKRLALDYELREKMGKANYQRSQEFRSDLVVSRMLEIMLPGSAIPVPVGKELTIRQL